MSQFACGRIELIIGPMFAGKTTELMRRVKREIHARRRCFVIKYANDVRYDDKPHNPAITNNNTTNDNTNNNKNKNSSKATSQVAADSCALQAHNSLSSHDKAKLRARASVRLLSEIKQEEWIDYDVIAIDEGQFFNDLIEFVTCAANTFNKVIMISALDGDYQCKPFKSIVELIPHCESVSKLTAVCMLCHSAEASFTRRTVKSDARELIGGPEMYIATCRKCYFDSLSSNADEKACNSSTEVLRLPFMQDVRQAMKEVEEECHVGNPLQHHTHGNSMQRSSTDESAADNDVHQTNNNNKNKNKNNNNENAKITSESKVKDNQVVTDEPACQHGDSPEECTNAGATYIHNDNNNSLISKISINDNGYEQEMPMYNVHKKSPVAVISYDDGVSPSNSHDGECSSTSTSGSSSVASGSHPNSPQAVLNLDEVHLKEHDDCNKLEMTSCNAEKEQDQHCGQKRMRSNDDDDDDDVVVEGQRERKCTLPLRERTNMLVGQKIQPIRHALASEERLDNINN